jgi:hypothetical protein
MLRTAAILVAIAAPLLAAPAARADQFLGVETPGDETPAPAPQATKRSAAKAAPKEQADDDGGLFDSVRVSGGFGLGPGYVDGELTIGYSVNRYVGIDTTYWYYRLDQGDTSGQQYGPEVDLVLRVPNKTILTPYVGAGPGYIKWQRTYQSKAFDIGASPTASAYGGVHVRLTRHFGLQVERREVEWLGNTPKSFDDRSTPEPRVSMTTKLDFRVAL